VQLDAQVLATSCAIALCRVLPNELDRIARKGARVAREAGDTRLLATTESNRIMSALLVGDVARAGRAAGRIRRDIDVRAANDRRFLASFELATTHLDGPVDAIDASFKSLQDQLKLESPARFLLHGWQHRMIVREARGTLDSILEWSRKFWQHAVVGDIYLSHIHVQGGRLKEASRHLNQVTKLSLDKWPRQPSWLFDFALLAQTTTALGDTGSAEILYNEMIPWAATGASTTSLIHYGSVSLWLGVLATGLKRWDAAEKHFDDAHEFESRMGGQSWIAQTAYQRAVMYAGRAGENDSPLALEYLARAESNSRRFGHVALVQRCATLRGKLMEA
jgi:tetratricopeptide (TPR) repeat protein